MIQTVDYLTFMMMHAGIKKCLKKMDTGFSFVIIRLEMCNLKTSFLVRVFNVYPATLKFSVNKTTYKRTIRRKENPVYISRNIEYHDCMLHINWKAMCIIATVHNL